MRGAEPDGGAEPARGTCGVDGGAFQNEITERNVMGVPAVFVNGKEFGRGTYDSDEIVAKVDTGAEKRAAG